MCSMSSFTLSLSSNSSELSASYYPPIELDRDAEYVCGLVDFQSYMSIPNVIAGKNVFCFTNSLRCEIPPELASNAELSLYEIRKCLETEKRKRKYDISRTDIAWLKKLNNDGTEVEVHYYKYIIVPPGSYEFIDLVKYLSDAMIKLDSLAHLSIDIDKRTLKCRLQSNKDIIFAASRNTMGSIFGFKDNKLDKNILHTSERIVRITSTNAVKIESNITTGAYSNNKLMRTLHEFYPAVDVGYKIVEVPRHVIYLPVSVRSIHNFSVRVVDQDDNLIDFRGETITLRVHIKRI